MRHRVKKDFVLQGTLLLFGESLFLQETVTKNEWEVYSFFTRKMIGHIDADQVNLHLEEIKTVPKNKFNKGKFLPILLLFLLPFKGISQKVKIPIDWGVKIVQVSDKMFELHISAVIDSGYFVYPINERKKCEYSPLVVLEPSPFWRLVEDPALYSYGEKFVPNKCGGPSYPYCLIERYTGSVEYIFLIKSNKHTEPPFVNGFIEFYPITRDSVGEMKRVIFSYSLKDLATTKTQ